MPDEPQNDERLQTRLLAALEGRGGVYPGQLHKVLFTPAVPELDGERWKALRAALGCLLADGRIERDDSRVAFRLPRAHPAKASAAGANPGAGRGARRSRVVNAARAETPPVSKARRHPSQPDWLGEVERVAGRFERTTDGECEVYIVLLADCDGPGSYGLYVGQTAIGAELRFQNHRTGHKASSCVKKFGARLLSDATTHLRKMTRAEAESIERQLAPALRRALLARGVRVYGGH